MATNLLLPEKDLAGVSEIRRLEIQLHWLKQLPISITTATKADLNHNKKSLSGTLLKLLRSSLPPALRVLLADSFVALISVSDFSTISETINTCNECIRSKDDNIANKLTCLMCSQAIFRKHGRMAGSSFLDVVQVLLKCWKLSECRCNILNCFESIIFGLGSSSASIHKDVYKIIKQGLTDKYLPVRVEAAKCAIELAKNSTFLYTQEMDSISQCCLKSFENSSYNVRCTVALLLGYLLAMTQKPLISQLKGKLKMPNLVDCLTILSSGYIKGVSGFLKAGGSELLKGSGPSFIREIRIGVSQAYIFFFAEMGGIWLERHLPLLLSHLLELLCNSKTTSTHVDAVYTRKCIGFVIEHSFNTLLGEPAQLVACNQLCKLVQDYYRIQSQSIEEQEKEKPVQYQHAIVCAIHQLGRLILSLNTAAQPLIATTDNELILGGDNPAPFIKVLDKVLLSQSDAVRLSAAGTVYCIGSSLPSLITPLVDYLMKGLKINRGNIEGVIGYSNCLAALLSSSQFTELGIPSVKALEIFKYGEEMIMTKFDGGKLSLSNVQSGWALIGAYLSLGPSYVRVNLRNVISLWHSVFPHSRQELLTEMKSGNALSWRHILEARNGAITSIVVFASSCKSLLTTELCKRLMLPLDSALSMTTGLLDLCKNHGVQLKALSAMLRLRLYQAFIQLPPTAYEGCLNALLKEVVAEFTLTNHMSVTTTSLLRSLCHKDDSILLGSWLEETDHIIIEEMLQPNSASGSGALEHDPASSYLYANKGGKPTEPLPLGVAVIDASIELFGCIFYQLSDNHQNQLLTHFKECIKQAKPFNRQQAIQINIITGFLAGLKGIVSNKATLSNNNDIISNGYSLIKDALCSPDPMLRCAGSESLGRLSQVIDDTGYVGQLVQLSVGVINTTMKDINTKSGHILSLGCLHRYVGSMGSGQHLQQTVNILQQLATDNTNTLGQVWGIHAVTLIADSGGPLFRGHVDSTIQLLLSLLINTPIINTQMYRCLGNCLSALLTTLGPELQMNTKSMTKLRETCLLCCYIVQCHPDPVVKSSAINCLQQLQLFAPMQISFNEEVLVLCEYLNSSHLLLRRAAANCLRQFTQQLPNQVWEVIAIDTTTNKGLDKIILSKLDIETDEKLRFDLKEILFSLLSSLAPNDPMKWLLLCNNVLSATQQTDDIVNDDVVDEDDEMSAKFTTNNEQILITNISPRWATKVFAIKCSRKIYKVCKSNPAHFDLTLAQQKQTQEGGDYLVMHLSELVKTSFIAATASVDQLKLEGYKALQDVIQLFASTIDPDYPGHVLLEQYQAQIGAALRPAFTNDSAPHVTAMACQVCSEWLGSGVSRDITDLKRVQQLLVSSLNKLHDIGSSTTIYGDAVTTLESLAVLKAWAELYIKLSENDYSNTNELISPHLPILSKYWILAIQDHAYLSLPAKFNSQLSLTSGTFYNSLILEFVKPYYSANWSSLLHAAALCITRQQKQQQQQTTPAFASQVPINMGVASSPIDERYNTYHMVLGVAIQALCNSDTYESQYNVICCLNAIKELINSQLSKEILSNEEQLIFELLNLLHRVIVTTTSSLTIITLVLDVAKHIISIINNNIADRRITESLLLVVTYCLFNYIPGLSSTITTQPAIISTIKYSVICQSINLFPLIPSLYDNSNDILPLLFYLTIAGLSFIDESCFNIASQSFKSLCLLVPSDSSHILHAVLSSIMITQLSQHAKLLLTCIVLMAESCTIPNQSLFDQWADFTVSCLNTSDNTKLQLTTLQVYETIFDSPSKSLAANCILKVTPNILQYIEKWKKAPSIGSHDVVTRCIIVLDNLLKNTPSDKKYNMLNLLLPVFISLLVLPNQQASYDQRIVHNYVLKTIINSSSLYKNAFKSVISKYPQLKQQLERAIKSDHDHSKNTPAKNIGKTQQQPAIKLKMDFSNFK